MSANAPAGAGARWDHDSIAAGLRADPGVWYLVATDTRAHHRRLRQTAYVISRNMIAAYADGEWQTRVSVVGEESRLYVRLVPLPAVDTLP